MTWLDTSTRDAIGVVRVEAGVSEAEAEAWRPAAVGVVVEVGHFARPEEVEVELELAHFLQQAVVVLLALQCHRKPRRLSPA